MKKDHRWEEYQKTGLGRYLISRSETVHEFCIRSRLSVKTIYKILENQPVRADIVKKVLKATKGALSLKDLLVYSWYDSSGNTGNTDTLGSCQSDKVGTFVQPESSRKEDCSAADRTAI